MRRRKKSALASRGLEPSAARAAFSRSLLVAVAVLSTACGEGTAADDPAPIENGIAASAVTAPSGPHCVDAGVPPGDRVNGAEAVAAPPSCTVPLTRRGKPLTIPYQIR